MHGKINKEAPVVAIWPNTTQRLMKLSWKRGIHEVLIRNGIDGAFMQGTKAWCLECQELVL